MQSGSLDTGGGGAPKHKGFTMGFIKAWIMGFPIGFPLEFIRIYYIFMYKFFYKLSLLFKRIIGYEKPLRVALLAYLSLKFKTFKPHYESILYEGCLEAKKLGIKKLSIETGSGEFFEPARKLFAKFDFQPCSPFAHYKEDPNSCFYTKDLN